MQKALGALVIVFAAFFLLTQPQAAADVVRGAADAIGEVFETVIAFLNALFD